LCSHQITIFLTQNFHQNLATLGHFCSKEFIWLTLNFFVT
jgi:hypothetical protein